jgi:uncharacterized damage-inducible protein DinB
MLLPEFDHEMGITRRLLERVPEADLAWKPHDRSMSLGALAAHLSRIPAWSDVITQKPEFDLGVAPDAPAGEEPASRDALLELFDRHVAEARTRFASMSDPEYLAMWTFKKDGQVVFSLPRVAALRGFLMNHSVHHRGQLSVYLRLRNVPLPAMYGPSADEG